ncbi:ABC transporter ATP-binding protein [Candidatus Heimdallarchaeota archaeon B3_Heim]|nr:MAG: ABC transporter ATP-binding protein [Candidatus Heimdallarchaeota archaeon B3_Heim]
MSFAVQMKNISKTFPGPVKANIAVNLHIQKGEIHALLGENGAGKTTLMNVLYGLYGPDQTEDSYILVNGKDVQIKEPIDAMNVGIGMVHQHFMLIPNMTVAENCGLGAESTFIGGRLNEMETKAKVAAISHEYRLDIDPDILIEKLPVGLQQRVEILKILYRGAEILILDEPTAVLTPQEVDSLFKTLKMLQEKENKTIIIITHKLKEPMALADRITVLRRGEVIGTVDTKDTSPALLAEMMIGRKLITMTKDVIKRGEKVLGIENIVAEDDRSQIALKGISLEIHAGEILGIAGVVGNGQRELAEVITGLRSLKSGKITLKNLDITGKDPRYLYDHGLAHIPEDRQKTGSIGDFTIAENLILGVHHQDEWYSSSTRGVTSKIIKFFDWNKINLTAADRSERYDIRTPTIFTIMKYLSGGNQQKVIVARELSKEPILIVASQPTRGLDVGVIEYVHKRLFELRDSGKAILLISSDLDEILTLSDRIAVLFEGEIVAIEDPNETNEQRLGLLMAGHKE